MRLLALYACDKADAAGIVFVFRAVKALRWGQASKWVKFRHGSRNLLGFVQLYSLPGIAIQSSAGESYCVDTSTWCQTVFPESVYHTTPGPELSLDNCRTFFIHRIRILNCL